MKKVLIISPDSKHFVREYIENVIDFNEYDVTFFTISRNQHDKDYYDDHNVSCVGIKKDAGGDISKNILSATSAWFWLLNNKDNYDVIHIHYMDVRFLKFCKVLLKTKSKLVITFWGSDLLREATGDHKVVKEFYPWVEKASNINLMENNSLNVFRELFPTINENKVCVLDFGDSLLPIIQLETENLGKDKAKEKFKIPTDKIIIHIGHNGSAAHQHLQLLDSLKELTVDEKEKLFIVMHFGYGIGGDGYSKEEYLEAVREKANSIGINYILKTEYLYGTELADFRLTADVLLYGQITDAISSSVVETVYAGGLFINPSWLDYSEFKSMGIKYVEYSDFDGIPHIIEHIISNGLLTDKEVEKNKEAIWNSKSWDKLAPKWRKMYD